MQDFVIVKIVSTLVTFPTELSDILYQQIGSLDFTGKGYVDWKSAKVNCGSKEQGGWKIFTILKTFQNTHYF